MGKMAFCLIKYLTDLIGFYLKKENLLSGKRKPHRFKNQRNGSAYPGIARD